MSANNLQDENTFDKLLRSNLRKHTEPIKLGFTDDILKQVHLLEEQKILAKIIIQERLALISCISLILLIGAAAVCFGKSILSVLIFIGANNKDVLIAIEHITLFEWQLILIVLMTAIGFTLYCFVDNIRPIQLVRKLTNWLSLFN